MTPLSKIGHFIECNINGTEVLQTGINVNAGGRGLTLLVIISVQWSSGDMTGSRIDMIRCGYNGNNYVVTNISKEATNSSYLSLLDGVVYGIDSSGNLTIKSGSSGGYGSALFISNK